MRALAVALLLLAPGQEYELAYRFEKGMAYEDATERGHELIRLDGGKRQHWDVASKEVLRRTVLEVDDTGHPAVERVEVLAFVVDMKDNPEQHRIGKRELPEQGRSFVWRRLKKRWALFDERGDVTGHYPQLVERLKNWRDARLPPEPVAVGEEWDVPVKTFLETVGLPADRLKQLEGRALFRLEKVEGDVAVISVDVRYNWRMGVGLESAILKGTWRFDVAKGRDLSVAYEGTMKIDNGRTGEGSFRMERKVTYLP